VASASDRLRKANSPRAARDPVEAK
jgi:hypothetical protein